MYIWKCWYDTRKYFFFYLALFSLLPTLALLIHLWVTQPGQGSWLRPVTPAEAQVIGASTTRMFFILAFIMGIFSGLSLGAAGLGQEFRNGTLEHLLTQPRSRRYFIWTGWATGIAELFVLFNLAALVASGLLLWFVGTVYNWTMLMLSPLIFIAAAVSYGLAYLLAILLRGNTNAQPIALGIIILYALLGAGVNYLWQLELPGWGELFTWIFLEDTGEFPALSAAGWLMVALAFPLTAQWVFDRVEI